MANAAYNNAMEASSYQGLMGILMPAHKGSQSQAPKKEGDHYNDNSHVSDPWNKSFPEQENDGHSVPSVQPQ